MRRPRFAAMLLCALLLLSACGGNSAGAHVTVYRAVSPRYRTNGQLVCAESVAVSPGVNEISAAVSAFNGEPSDQTLRSPLPSGGRIIGFTAAGSDLQLELSPECAELSGMDLTLTVACLVLTFAGMEHTATVSVRCGDTVLSPPLTAADLVLSDASGS